MSEPRQAALTVPHAPALSAGLGTRSFADGYRTYFEVVPATTEQLKRHHYRIRHDVYCRELGYEPPRGNELESDHYDSHSLHCLVRAVATHMFVGGARIVLADPAAPEALLPFEKTCQGALDRRIVDPATMDRSAIGEISRLAVIEQYRRRQGERSTPMVLEADVGRGSRVRLPYLTLGIYLALLALARARRIGTLFLLTEPALARSIARLGVAVRAVGTPVDHRGTRIPSMLDVDAILAGLSPQVRPLFDMINAEVEQGLQTDC